MSVSPFPIPPLSPSTWRSTWRVAAAAVALFLVAVGVVAAAIGGAPLWGLGGVHLLRREWRGLGTLAIACAGGTMIFVAWSAAYAYQVGDGKMPKDW